MSEDKYEGARRNAQGWLESIEEMVKALQEAEHTEDAEQTIHESVLSVQVRGGWRNPGSIDPDEPEEYEILLSTGGPALRIWGKLDEYNDPKSAELQMQDWYVPWESYPAPEALLLIFARQFYFGQ